VDSEELLLATGGREEPSLRLSRSGRTSPAEDVRELALLVVLRDHPLVVERIESDLPREERLLRETAILAESLPLVM
jgi:hypothetical protein